jgi:hypothetical protein
LEVPPHAFKIVRISRPGYVTRTIRVDGSKPRVVVGLVSTASAKKRGLSQAEAEAAADRAAMSSAGVKAEKIVLEEDEPAPEPVERAPTASKAGKPEGKTTLAPNPFAE